MAVVPLPMFIPIEPGCGGTLPVWLLWVLGAIVLLMILLLVYLNIFRDLRRSWANRKR